MRIRAALLTMAIAGAIAAPMTAQTHVSDCNPNDRVVTVIGDPKVEGTIYIDDRGYEDMTLLPPEVAGPLADVTSNSPYGRVPMLSNSNDPDDRRGGVWVYLENGAEPGLQVGKQHAFLGDNSNLVAITFEDPCWGYKGLGKNMHNEATADPILL